MGSSLYNIHGDIEDNVPYRSLSRIRLTNRTAKPRRGIRQGRQPRSLPPPADRAQTDILHASKGNGRPIAEEVKIWFIVLPTPPTISSWILLNWADDGTRRS
jgi:hypothetical protein